MRFHSLLGLGLAGFTLTSAAPPPLPQARIPAPPVRDPDSPVRCRTAEPIRYTSPTPKAGHPTQAPNVPQRVMAPAPAAPPAPPPPPAPPVRTSNAIPQSAARNVFVSGNRVGTPPAYGAAGNTERYAGEDVASVQSVAQAPVSTFAVDVDTGSYANVRRFLTGGAMPPQAAVRTEEMINYFRYDYPRPESRDVPFSVTTDVAKTPWNSDTRLLRIGLRGYDVTAEGRPPANLVFLLDVSGSMNSPDKLPLLKDALTRLADNLTAKDRVSMVVYAGAAGVVLEPTHNTDYVKQAIDCLSAGGSTAGGAGIKLAYSMARANFVKGGVNRIFLATDGDFNVGVSDDTVLEEMVEKEREDGITLTTLGFGTGNYNEAMMERIADVGNGNYAYIDNAMEARKVLDEELSATLVTIAKDVKVQVEFNPAQVKQYRLIGYENRALAEEDFDNDTVDAGDIGAGHQVTALYEVVPAGGKGWLPDRRYAANRAPAASGTGSEMCFVKLRYKLPGGDTSKLIRRPVPARLMQTAEAPHGDMAFATAVAAFGQHLRGDKYLEGYSYPRIATLAGDPRGYWRSEFTKLVELAGDHAPDQSGTD